MSDIGIGVVVCTFMIIIVLALIYDTHIEEEQEKQAKEYQQAQEREKSRLEEVEKQQRLQEYARKQEELAAKRPALLLAAAAGHDVCFDCGTIDPPRCSNGASCRGPDGKTACLNCTPVDYPGVCYNCDWSSD